MENGKIRKLPLQPRPRQKMGYNNPRRKELPRRRYEMLRPKLRQKSQITNLQ